MWLIDSAYVSIFCRYWSKCLRWMSKWVRRKPFLHRRTRSSNFCFHSVQSYSFDIQSFNSVQMLNFIYNRLLFLCWLSSCGIDDREWFSEYGGCSDFKPGIHRINGASMSAFVYNFFDQSASDIRYFFWNLVFRNDMQALWTTNSASSASTFVWSKKCNSNTWNNTKHAFCLWISSILSMVVIMKLIDFFHVANFCRYWSKCLRWMSKWVRRKPCLHVVRARQSSVFASYSFDIQSSSYVQIMNFIYNGFLFLYWLRSCGIDDREWFSEYGGCSYFEPGICQTFDTNA